MADKNNRSNGVLNMIRNLNTATKATNAQTYGISRDPAGTIKDNLDDYIESVRADAANADKQVINSRMSRYRLGNNNTTANNLYDIIKDQDMLNTVQSLIGSENLKFAQTLKDYEIIKRCLPQVHKVISSLKNNIISPDALVNNSIGIKYPVNISASDKDKIDSFIDKYELNEKIQEWVMDYLICSVKYVVPVPYSSIPDLLETKSINEGIEILRDDIGEARSLYESAGNKSTDISLNEAISIEVPEVKDGVVSDTTSSLNIDSKALNEAIDTTLKDIEFISGGTEYFKRAVYNEAVSLSKYTDSDDISMKTVLKRLKALDKEKKSKVAYFDTVNDGLISDASLKDIRKKVKFRGCHIDELNPSKCIPFKMRNTIIGYFYVEDKYADGVTRGNQNNLSTIMDKINSSVYMKNDSGNNAARVESLVIRSISDRLIKSIDARFLNDNFDDMDIIYEFVKDNALYQGNKRVVFFHPDDVCEFRRKEGSIMKNCMFYAKLYILTLLSNVITNVTRGADRQMYYVKTGLTTDIEGNVNSTIRAIKQNQIRYSDMGTINEIFNLVGSTVDLFMPVSVDGDRPIETETVSGQNVDMNNDFLQWLMKSIIQSFGVPASVVDDFENIEFAKTIAMSNMDMAKATLDAQNEIVPTLTKVLRAIISYEMPEFSNVDDIEATLAAPSIIVFEMNRERVDSVNSMAETLSGLLFAPEGETLADKRVRLFKLAYFKANMPMIDWPAIEEMVSNVRANSKLEEKEEAINAPADDGTSAF